MNNRCLAIVMTLIVSGLILSACNLPNRVASATQTPIPSSVPLVLSTPTPSSACANPYFPIKTGNRWEYTGNNTISGDYRRTDSITSSGDTAFTQEVSQADVTYSIIYDCSASGISSTNPVEQYAGALLSSPNMPVEVKLTSNSGISLPSTIKPGDTWQQSADFDATSPQLNMSGRFVFNYSAVGYESISVPAGSYNALRVDTTIRIEVTGLHVLAGTYTTSSWLAPEIGMIKSQGTSQISGVDFSDSLQLSGFTPAP